MVAHRGVRAAQPLHRVPQAAVLCHLAGDAVSAVRRLLLALPAEAVRHVSDWGLLAGVMLMRPWSRKGTLVAAGAHMTSANLCGVL